jgi:hypothetical protein
VTRKGDGGGDGSSVLLASSSRSSSSRRSSTSGPGCGHTHGVTSSHPVTGDSTAGTQQQQQQQQHSTAMASSGCGRPEASGSTCGVVGVGAADRTVGPVSTVSGGVCMGVAVISADNNTCDLQPGLSGSGGAAAAAAVGLSNPSRSSSSGMPEGFLPPLHRTSTTSSRNSSRSILLPAASEPAIDPDTAPTAAAAAAGGGGGHGPAGDMVGSRRCSQNMEASPSCHYEAEASAVAVPRPSTGGCSSSSSQGSDSMAAQHLAAALSSGSRQPPATSSSTSSSNPGLAALVPGLQLGGLRGHISAGGGYMYRTNPHAGRTNDNRECSCWLSPGNSALLQPSTLIMHQAHVVQHLTTYCAMGRLCLN